MNTGALVALTVFIEAFLHYFPWRKILRGRDLPRLAAYVLGVLGFMVPITVWLLEQHEFVILQVLWLAILAGGTSVLALYGLDHVVELDWRSRESEQREALMQEQRHGKGKPA
jgi:hypothetical protein